MAVRWLTVLVLIVSSTASGAQYAYIDLVDNRSALPLTFEPSISADGRAVFAARALPDPWFIATSDGRPLQIVYGADNYPGMVSLCGISPGGIVAFTGFLDTDGDGSFDTSGLYTGNGGPYTVVTEQVALFLAQPSVNTAGMVAFAGYDGSKHAVLKGDGGPLTYVADNTGVFSMFGDRPDINASGLVAFLADRAAGGQAICLGDGATVSTIADTDGALAVLNDPVINDQNVVAFTATRDDASSGIFKWEGGVVSPVVDDQGAFEDFTPAGFEGIGIDNQGQVCFRAGLDGGGAGIFNGPDPIADRVVITGDTVDGSTVIGLALGHDSMNDLGWVAFGAELADGREGLFLAEPCPSLRDVDGDGSLNCDDECPSDSGKTKPGVCGCGDPDEGDRDGDYVLDCVDGCPDDPAKTDPGVCGCGVSDDGDADADGTPDACDPCTDTDGDGAGDPGFPANTCPTDQCPDTVPGSPVNYLGCPPRILGDFDRDGDVDAGDLAVFAGCGSGAAVAFIPGCHNLDSGFDVYIDPDGDGDCDQADFAGLQRCISGEDIPAPFSCYYYGGDF